MSNEIINNVNVKSLAYSLRDEETRKKAQQQDTYAIRHTKVYEVFVNPEDLKDI